MAAYEDMVKTTLGLAPPGNTRLPPSRLTSVRKIIRKSKKVMAQSLPFGRKSY
jgi:hypothetical protein